MTGRPQQHTGASNPYDALAVLTHTINDAIAQNDLYTASSLVENNIAAVWFGIPPTKMVEVLDVLVNQTDSPSPLLQAAYRILSAQLAGEFKSQPLLSAIDDDDPQQLFVLTMFRINDLRQKGRIREAFAQTESLNDLLGKMRYNLDPNGGWRLQSAIEIGISAMLAGDFTKALGAFTQVQLHATVPKYVYLTRDSLVKSALIHACFGNSKTALAFIERTNRIQTSSSWIETRISAQQDLVKALTHADNIAEATDQLEAVNLDEIGEMWPFYVVALHRIFETAGRYDELDRRLEFLDSLPLPRLDQDGFSGSVIPLKRAMLALQLGRGSQAHRLLDRADPHLAYTQLILAAAHLYTGHNEQALQQASGLRHQTRGFRLMELRRLSIVSTAQYQCGQTNEALSTLQYAAALPRGLGPTEIALFKPTIQRFAEKRIKGWPAHSDNHSTFLIGIPQTAATLTPRETEIVKHLAQNRTRAEIAKELFVSQNTVKTQLRSIFRKLEVTSAAGAIRESQRRGIL